MVVAFRAELDQSEGMVVFFHGLNTYGDDDVHIGPLKFGRMHARVEKALAARGVTIKAPLELGAGSPEEQAARAKPQLPQGRLHLVGQSTGGLIARVLAHDPELEERVASVITIGTPHAGTWAARMGLEFETRAPRLSRLFRLAGYSTRAKSQIFRFYTPEAMADFNRRFPASRAREISLICEVSRAGLSWPLQFLYDRLHPRGEPGDGFIWSESQRRGDARGPFGLDHFGELGFFPHLDPRARRHARAEFSRLIATLAELVAK